MEELEDLDQFIARTKPLRKYEKYWVMAKASGRIQIELEDASPATRKRYIKGIKREKMWDRKDRHSGILRFSWVGRMLTVLFILRANFIPKSRGHTYVRIRKIIS